MKILKSCIKELYDNIIPYKMHFIYKLQDNWNNIIGENISKHSYPQKIFNKVLIILVDDDIWLQELSLNKDEITNKIFQEFPELKNNKIIENIKFKVGKIENINKKINKNNKKNFYISKDVINKIEETIKDIKDENVKEGLRNYLIKINLKEK